MTCPYLCGVYLRICSVARGIYVPGACELHNCCISDQENRFARCAFYRAAVPHPVRKTGLSPAGEQLSMASTVAR